MRNLVMEAAAPVTKLEETFKEERCTDHGQNAHGSKDIDVVTPI